MSHRILATMGLIIWAASVGAVPEQIEPPKVQEDSWVGTYAVYERWSDGLYRPSKRHEGKVTIARHDDFYTVHFAPKVQLRKVNERVLDAGDQSGQPRRVELRIEGGQRVLEVQSSFHSLHLIQGKVPKTWKLAPD